MTSEAESPKAGTGNNLHFMNSILSEAAGPSSSSGTLDAGNSFRSSSASEIPPADGSEDFDDSTFIVIQRKPLPMPYLPPTLFTSPGRLSKELWCPSLYDRIENEYTPAAANYLYSIPRKLPALRDHMNCTSERCTANDTDAENYQIFHWSRECLDETACEFIGPHAQDVRDIIADGRIPLISIRKLPTGDLSMKVVRATFKSKFFAISHVWSGGLGNPKANKLPVCQIARLHQLGVEIHSRSWKHRLYGKLVSNRLVSRHFNQANEESLFWMDTLCIPVGNPSLKWRAIDSMARIYAAAQSVVVIDHELQQTPHKKLYRGSIFGRLFCSAWASRCWTYQEGALAKEWLVQFEDGLCSVDKLFKARPETLEQQVRGSIPFPGPEPEERAVASQVAQWFIDTPRLQESTGRIGFSHDPNRLPFLEIWNSLCLRTTTQKDDLISIIAIMLDLRPSEVQKLPFELQLLSIFHHQELLPLGLLFRERSEIKSWQQARCWLPTTIEERPASAVDCLMRRRSKEEYFFVFECSQIQRFYFANVEMGRERGLYLADPTSGEALNITFLLSADLNMPSMDICIMLGDKLTSVSLMDEEEIITHTDFARRHRIEEITQAFGVCLGVRKATEEYVQFFYICPVKCVGDYSGTVRDDMMLASAVEIPCLKYGMECVIEHGKRPILQLYLQHNFECH